LKKYLKSYWIRSAFYTFLQRFSVTLFGLINFMLLVRHLSKPQMGTWALFLIITTIFETTKTGLLKNAHIRFVSGSENQHEKAAIASSSLIINALLSIVFIAFILLFSSTLSTWLHAGADLSRMLIWFIPGLICMVMFSHFEAVQQSHLDFKGGFAGYFARQLLFFLVILIYVIFKIPFSLVHLALYQSLSIVIGTLLLYLYSRKYMLHLFNPTKAWVKKILGFGGYIFGSGIIANLFSNLDQIMTARFMSSSSVAYYNTATRVNTLVDMPSFVAADILFPKSSRASYEEGPGKVKYLYEKMVAILLCVTMPMAVFIILFPQFIIKIIASSTYLAAAPILQMYMLAGIVRPLQNQGANLLNSIGKPRLCFTINTIVLIVNLPINYYCLSHFGFYGAAMGTLITLTLSTITWYFIMKKQIGLQIGSVLSYMMEFYKNLYARSMALLGKTRNANL
jgi:O-antigen/teichoic acid export membrane protein